jgi:hypothetical protein
MKDFGKDMQEVKVSKSALVASLSLQRDFCCYIVFTFWKSCCKLLNTVKVEIKKFVQGIIFKKIIDTAKKF